MAGFLMIGLRSDVRRNHRNRRESDDSNGARVNPENP